MELFGIILLCWVLSGWVGGSIFSYLDVRFAGHQLNVMDVILGIGMVGGVLGPVVYWMILKDLQYFYPLFRNSRGE